MGCCSPLAARVYPRSRHLGQSSLSGPPLPLNPLGDVASNANVSVSASVPESSLATKSVRIPGQALPEPLSATSNHMSDPPAGHTSSPVAESTPIVYPELPPTLDASSPSSSHSLTPHELETFPLFWEFGFANDCFFVDRQGSMTFNEQSQRRVLLFIQVALCMAMNIDPPTHLEVTQPCPMQFSSPPGTDLFSTVHTAGQDPPAFFTEGPHSLLSNPSGAFESSASFIPIQATDSTIAETWTLKSNHKKERKRSRSHSSEQSSRSKRPRTRTSGHSGGAASASSGGEDKASEDQQGERNSEGELSGVRGEVYNQTHVSGQNHEASSKVLHNLEMEARDRSDEKGEHPCLLEHTVLMLALTTML
jgi:hypothetical protein